LQIYGGCVGRSVVDTNRIGQLGISWLRWIVEGQWGCGIEVVSAHNDDSLDLLILLKRRRGSAYAGPTGDVIFAQVKTGYVKSSPSTDYSIDLKRKYINSHHGRWLSFPGPVIMINVIPPKAVGGNPSAYWANLRDPAVLARPGFVKFRLSDALEGRKGKASLFNLCWSWAEFRRAPRVQSPVNLGWSSNIPGRKFSAGQNMHLVCRAFYKDWMAESAVNSNAFGGVKVTNRGWRHMTRIGRGKARMLQSLLLLPSASRILQDLNSIGKCRITSTEERHLPNGTKRERWYEAATARVSFFERQDAMVRVVLERNVVSSRAGSIIRDDLTLYSIYEVARGRSETCG